MDLTHDEGIASKLPISHLLSEQNSVAYDEISSEDLMQMLSVSIETLSLTPRVVVVDIRRPEDYSAQKIRGSYNVFVPPLLERRWLRTYSNNIPDPAKILLHTFISPDECRTRFVQLEKQSATAVLVDYGESLPLVAGSVAYTVLGQLQTMFSRVCVLSGGFECWKLAESAEYTLRTSNNRTSDIARTTSFRLKPVIRTYGAVYPLSECGPRIDSSIPPLPSRILEWLFVGPDLHGHMSDLQAAKLLQGLDISCVVNVCGDNDHAGKVSTLVPAYIHLGFRDTVDEKIDHILEAATDYISDQHALGRRVYVHCHAGKSRSPTIVAAYLIRFENMTSDSALRLIRERRPIIAPNIGFITELREFETLFRNKTV